MRSQTPYSSIRCSIYPFDARLPEIPMQRRIPSDALRFSLLATPLALMLAAGCGSNGTPQDTGSTAPQAMNRAREELHTR